MFRGARPASQPRSLRSIAESRNGTSSFVNVAPSNPRVTYDDPAEAAKSQGVGRRPMDAATPSPFSNLKDMKQNGR